MSDRPMFLDVSHALHVSFLVLSMPPRQKAPFRNMLIQLLEAIEDPTAAQDRWLAELRGGPPGGGAWDPDRLTMDEFRAQCAMIADAARTRLPLTEYCAVLARFGHGPQKAEGCQALARHAYRISGLTAQKLILALVARHYLPRKHRDGFSIRDVAEANGASSGKVFRAARWMEDHFRALEDSAIARLEPSFRAHGVIRDHYSGDFQQSLAL